MRLVIAAAGLALIAVAPAAAQPAPLAANELLFEVRAMGRAQSRPDFAVVTLNFTAQGQTAPEARAMAEALCGRLIEIARPFGAERQTVPNGPSLGPGPMSDQITTFGGGGEPEPGEGRLRAPFTSNGAIRLSLRDGARFAELRGALEAAGALNIIGPTYQIADDSAARRAARLDALTKARVDADQFAASQNMRVVRMVRFSETTDAQAEMMQVIMTQMSGRPAGAPSQVETSVNATVSFALAPR